MTDAKGRTVSFKNAVIIMTSNIGSEIIYKSDSLGFNEDKNKIIQPKESEIREKVLFELRSNFKPEFLNRLDEIIIFHPLSRKIIERILDLQIEILRKRLFKKDIDISFSDKAKKYLVQKGFDPVYGARPLKRVIQSDILDELALKIIEGRVSEGEKISVDFKNKKIVIK